MKLRTVMASIALVLVGAIGGTAATLWRASNEWDEWFVKFNMSPLMSEQTFALKFLRRDEHKKLQSMLEETVWRQIEIYADLKANGKPWPEDAMTSLKYHCLYNKEQSGSDDATVSSRRTAWCNSLLSK